MRRSLSVVLLAGAMGIAHLLAAPDDLHPTLVRDIIPGWHESSYPNGLTAAGGRLFFGAADAGHGVELWTSDGTNAGTRLVKDINPGAFDSMPSWDLWMIDVCGTLFFSADDGAHGTELWKSDGTPEGTTLVKDINPGPASSIISVYSTHAHIGNTLYFAADDGVHGPELWRSDGSAVGTYLVKDAEPGPVGSNWFNPTSMVVAGDALYFVATTQSIGTELWRSDGTEAGTRLVKDLNPGGGGSYPYNLTVLGDSVFFTCNDGIHGVELCLSDGNASGTRLVEDIMPGPGNSYPESLTSAGDWLVFSADDGMHGFEPWRSNSTDSATMLIADINVGLPSSNAQAFMRVGDFVAFVASDGTHGVELWATHGTEAGTALVRDINPGPGDAWPYGFTNIGGTLFFGADDGSAEAGGLNNRELWTSDGTPGGTALVRRAEQGFHSSNWRAFGQYPSMPLWLTNVGGRLFYRGFGAGSGEELWMLR